MPAPFAARTCVPDPGYRDRGDRPRAMRRESPHGCSGGGPVFRDRPEPWAARMPVAVHDRPTARQPEPVVRSPVPADRYRADHGILPSGMDAAAIIGELGVVDGVLRDMEAHPATGDAVSRAACRRGHLLRRRADLLAEQARRAATATRPPVADGPEVLDADHPLVRAIAGLPV